jgi:hypothetical protein
LKELIKEQADEGDRQAAKEGWVDDAKRLNKELGIPKKEAYKRSKRADRKKMGAFREWNAADAEEVTAQRWIASLRPDFPIAWLDDGHPLYFYDPETREWR